MKKILSFLALGILSTQVSLQAYGTGSYYGDGCCPTDCCQQQECCEFGKFTVGADWLYWSLHQSDLAFGLDVDTSEAGVVKTRILEPNFDKYHNGFRVFADYATADKKWQFAVIYSHLPGSAQRSRTFDLETLGSVSGSFLGDDLGAGVPLAAAEDPLLSLKGNWDTSFNYIDLVTARAFNVCENFELSPYIGIRGLWNKHTFHFSAEVPVDVDVVGFADAKVTRKLGAVGLLGGVKGDWRIFDGFYLVGNVGVSVLYGWHTRHADISVGANDEVALAFEISSPEERHGVPMFDAFIGLAYENSWEGFGFNIHAGWEEHILLNTRGFGFRSGGHMTLQGLTLGAGVSF
jgi:hypothetical protein